MSIDKSTKDKDNSPVIDISPKQRRIVKAKIKGMTHDKIAEVEYPTANPEHRRKIVSNELKKPNVAQYLEQSKLLALKEYNITWGRIISPINDALDFSDGKPIENINIRLKGSKEARDLMESKQVDHEIKEQLKSIPFDADEIHLIKAYKNRL